MGTHLIQERLAQRPESAARPRLRRWRIALAAGALVALSALVVGAQYSVSASGGESTVDGSASTPLVRIAPQVAGRVLRVHVGDDQSVQAGDLLVEIDAEDFAITLVQANARAAEARGRLDQARWQLPIAQAVRTMVAADLVVTQERARDAVDKRTAELLLVVAEAKLVAADAQVNLARARIETAGARFITAQASAAQARIRLTHTKIHAPRTGRVRTRSVEPGDYAQVGQELMALDSDERSSPDPSRQRVAPPPTVAEPHAGGREGAAGWIWPKGGAGAGARLRPELRLMSSGLDARGLEAPPQ